MKRLYTFREAAKEIFGDESKQQVLRLRAWRGQFPTVKWGGRRYVRAEDMEKFLAALPLV